MIALAALLGMLAGCATTEGLLPDRRPDYRKSTVVSTLEVPPDLTASTLDDALVVPDLSPAGSASLSDYASERVGGGQLAPSERVLQAQPGMRLERDGSQRWLFVEQQPTDLWPKIKEFWTSNGILLRREDPRIGIMETEWVENRADIPEGFIRSVLKRAIDFAYSAPTRDKFRVRLERSPDGVGTDVYLTHYGVEEVIQGEPTARASQQTSGVAYWQGRPSDPELEAEMLNRLMVHLGGVDRREEAQLAGGETPSQQRSRARLVDRPDGQKALVVEDDYNRAWRLVGLALDGSNFVIEDQNRNDGLYVVEYSDPLAGQQDRGLLSRLAFWRDDKPPSEGTRYQVRLAGQGPQTLVMVYTADGRPDDSPMAERILDSLAKVIR